jgi:serine protease Do
MLVVYVTATAQSRPAKDNAGSLLTLSTAFEALAQQVGPSVVQIQTTEYAAVRGSGEGLRDQRGSGSGVILDPDGYIVTNAHVVRGARAIRVVLSWSQDEQPRWKSVLRPQGRVVPAHVVGTDPDTDLAVLKVEQKGLPALELADSDRLRQGQLVLAFGSPLGLDNSVTLGVVSAVARQLRAEDPMIYIQTDAPINPGNSGGPLVDGSGKVVGINALILSQSGGNEGIGFAAPSIIVKMVFDQIRNTGRVRRGQIGARAQTITPELASGLRLPQQWGVILGDVLPGSPAELAGLKVGDVVLSMNDKPMENARQFEVNLYRTEIGQSVQLQVQRGSEKISAAVRVAERATDPFRLAALIQRETKPVSGIGVLALDLKGAIADVLPPLRKPAGAMIAARLGDSAESVDLQPGDLICAVNGSVILDLAGLESALAALKPGDPVVLQVQRLGQLLYVAFELP